MDANDIFSAFSDIFGGSSAGPFSDIFGSQRGAGRTKGAEIKSNRKLLIS
jgi:hypothetical protein